MTWVAMANSWILLITVTWLAVANSWILRKHNGMGGQNAQNARFGHVFHAREREWRFVSINGGEVSDVS